MKTLLKRCFSSHVIFYLMLIVNCPHLIFIGSACLRPYTNLQCSWGILSVIMEILYCICSLICSSSVDQSQNSIKPRAHKSASLPAFDLFSKSGPIFAIYVSQMQEDVVCTQSFECFKFIKWLLNLYVIACVYMRDAI